MPGPASPAGIAIIGAGFSGTMMAIHLRRALPASCPIFLIERSGTFARGVAYAESAQPHLLNVRATNMSAFPDEPGDFTRWIETKGSLIDAELQPTEAGVFATRRLYGRYLQETLQNILSASSGTVTLRTEDVLSLASVAGGWHLCCRSGERIEVAGVVLACGNLPNPSRQNGVEILNPWAPDALAGLTPEQPVLIVGTGLTMVDLVLSLKAAGLRAPIYAVSRRGLLPQPHAAIGAAWPTPDIPLPARRSALSLLRHVRQELTLAAGQAIGWRAVIDSLRPITSSLWHDLPPAEQAHFMRHLRPYWDIHRHRMAPCVAATFTGLLNSGQLRIQRGRVKQINHLGPHVADVVLAPPAPAAPVHLQVQRIFYATGLRGLGDEGLPADLVATGIAKLDCHGLGLKVTSDLQICDISDQPAYHLWALGPLVRGMLWECLAVPDIRQQAQRLSDQIAKNPAFSRLFSVQQFTTASPAQPG